MGQSDQVRWLAIENIAKFQKLLNISTGDSRRRLLEELLAAEQDKLKMSSQDEIDCEPAIPPQAGLPLGEHHSAGLPNVGTKPR